MKKEIKILNAIWQIKYLGNQTILLETSSVSLSIIHKITQFILAAQWQGITDIVPAYNSIAIFYDKSIINISQIIQKIEAENFSKASYNIQIKIHEIPVCFENGLDWNEVEDLTQIKKTDFIKDFTSKNYTVAMLGFIPGFMYLDGLSKSLHCPRKQNPRLKIPAGSVGIGGSQTGIYALESPGGWQIIGQTPTILFNKKTLPPTFIQPLDKVRFYPINIDEFQKIVNENH
jgi:inhibitor of KinA